MTKDQDREAFEKAITVEGLHVNLTRIGPADSRSGEYAHTIVQTCWHVWQQALAYTREQEAAKEMSEQEQTTRDTHFQGFAKLLADELRVTGGYPISEVKQLIARRSYDLVHHTLLNASLRDLDSLTTEECVVNIPDLSTLPEERMKQ